MSAPPAADAANVEAASFPALIARGRRLLAAAPREGAAVQRIAIAGSVATDLLACAIACAVVQEGLNPVVHQAPFGAYAQEVLDPGSALHRFRPDLVVLAPDWRALADDFPPDAPPAAAAAWIGERVALFARLWAVIADALGAPIVQHTLVPPPALWRGAAERLSPASPCARAEALNAALLAAGAGRVHWVELDRLAAEIGTRAWAAERFHLAAKLPFDPRFLPDYVAPFRAAWRSACARSKKALVLDLDNTLWGGVIGDEGIEGIALGPGSPAGEAFAAWQGYVRDLGRRGVVLAVCSKNDPAIAAAAFAHPHAVLARADFAAFECSWDDKASGLRRVAAALNLSLDSLVFADDNDAECALVSALLPEVATVALGDDPAQFAERLDRGHWFDLAQYTADDFARAGSYAGRRRAEAARLETPDLGGYLRGLEMRGAVFRPDAAACARVAQLERKTNQFNLTGRRHDEAALAAFLADPAAVVLALRLRDRFADHGLVASLIAVAEGDALRIDSWVMSCRVFGRTAEAFVLRALLDEARRRGLRRIVGEYVPTPRNGVAAEAYAALGFAPVQGAAGMWARDVEVQPAAGPLTAIAA